jgi:group I intron endonuclease
MYRNPTNPRKDFNHFFIYCITNQINFKQYVGQHASLCSIEEDDYGGSGKLLYHAYKKYGKENFKRDVIEICESEDQLDEQETYWIKEKKSHVSFGGYNLTWGGEGNRGFKTSDKTKKLLSEKMKGKKISEETKKKISKSLKGIETWNKGLFLSDDHKEKISIANTGKKFTQIHKDRIAEGKLGDLNPAKLQTSRDKISESRKNKSVGSTNSMFNTHRTRSSKPVIKGDKFEYLRNKIKCTDIVSGEITVCDGLKEVREKFKISKNKYYNHLKTKEPINNQYVFEVL